jgi:hypothetical protein
MGGGWPGRHPPQDAILDSAFVNGSFSYKSQRLVLARTLACLPYLKRITVCAFYKMFSIRLRSTLRL